ncbi:kelch-like protein 25 [Planococcus citri]|uniref:kelch-like protein 25 n=1 Tax=Planococcus citri TaxID=170843 RepID=UPI0031F8A09E
MAGAASFEEIKLDILQNGTYDTMNKYRKENLFCDVSLDINGTLFPCHRLILTASSEYFQVMFNDNFKESSLKVVPMKEIDAETMEILLSAMYTTRIRLLPENVYFVLKASHMLRIHVIFNACVDCIMKNVHHIHYLPDTCSFAKSIEAEAGELYDKCVESLALAMFYWEKTDAFLHLSYDILKEVLSKVKSIDDSRDDDLLPVIIKWCKYNYHISTKDIRVLMRTCNFSPTLRFALAELIAAARSKDDDESAEDENQSNNCDFNLNLYLYAVDVKSGAKGWGSLKLDESFSNYTLSNFQAMDPLCRARICSVGLKTYYFERYFSTARKPYIFSCFEDGSRIDLQVPNDLHVYRSFKMLAVGTVIYFFEGRYGSNNNIWVYNCELDTWQNNTFQVPSHGNSSKSVLCDYSHWSDVTYLDHVIHVVGCKKRNSTSGDRYIMSIDTRAPQIKNLITFPSPFQHESAAVCAFDGKIAISGSNHDGTLHNTFSILDVTAGKWRTDLEPMNEGRAKHKLIHRNEFIYTVEKKPVIINNEKYDVKLNTWIEIPKLPERAEFVKPDGVSMTIGFGDLINAESIPL